MPSNKTLNEKNKKQKQKQNKKQKRQGKKRPLKGVIFSSTISQVLVSKRKVASYDDTNTDSVNNLCAI